MSNNSSPRPDRLKTLYEKRAAIEAQIARLNSETVKDQRKLDTRRKILIGAVVEQEAERDPRIAKWLRVQLARGLTSSRDRAVFNLSPLPENASSDLVGTAPGKPRS